MLFLRRHRSFGHYLADMGSLVLTLEDSFSGVLGEAAVRVTGLDEGSPIAGEVTFVQVGQPPYAPPEAGHCAFCGMVCALGHLWAIVRAVGRSTCSSSDKS